MKKSFPHALPLDRAREVAHHALDSYRQRFADREPELDWLDQDTAQASFRLGGRAVKATLRVLDHSFEIAMDVPLRFRPFQGVAVRILREEVDRWASRAVDSG